MCSMSCCLKHMMHDSKRATQQCSHWAFTEAHCFSTSNILTAHEDSPPKVASPLSEVDGHRDVADERDKDDDSNPWLQSRGQVDTGRRNVKDLGPNVENDSGQDALNRAGASVHDARHLTGFAVEVEVEI